MKESERVQQTDASEPESSQDFTHIVLSACPVRLMLVSGHASF